jgi:hypothetical protein
MAAAQHKLSRREVLAAGCVGAVPLPRHPGLGPGSMNTAATPGSTSVFMEPGLRRDDVERWRRALAPYARAEAEIEALKHCQDDDLYDRAVGRQIATLGRLLKAPAPDLAAAAWKLELIVRHAAYELCYGDKAFAVLLADLRRFAGVG